MTDEEALVLGAYVVLCGSLGGEYWTVAVA